MDKKNAPDAVDPDQPRIQPWTVYMIAAIIAGGFVVGWSLLGKIAEQSLEARQSGRLSVVSRLEENIVLLNDQNERVELKQLEGKVWIAANLYTDCPNGCTGIAAEMEDIRTEFADEEDFALASFSLDPESDTPEKLAAFREKNGFDADNWWFLTDDKDNLPSYMVRTFKFWAPQPKPESQRNGPTDLWDHDMRIALVDRVGQVRGFFDVWNADEATADLHRERLRKGIRSVLDGKADL